METKKKQNFLNCLILKKKIYNQRKRSKQIPKPNNKIITKYSQRNNSEVAHIQNPEITRTNCEFKTLMKIMSNF